MRYIFLIVTLLFINPPNTEAGRLKRIVYTFTLSAGSMYMMLYGIDSDHTSQSQKEKIVTSAGIGVAFVGLIETINLRNKAMLNLRTKKLNIPTPYVALNPTQKSHRIRANLASIRF